MDVPEFAYWASLTDHSATRAKIDDASNRVRSRIGDLERLFTGITFGVKPSLQRSLLAKAYRAILDHPIATGSIPGNLYIPQLGKAYIEPVFRLAEVSPQADPSADSLVGQRPGSLRSMALPCRILDVPCRKASTPGRSRQPGAGKSVLTKMLAAQLPAAGFMPVRVPLSESPAEGTIQDHRSKMPYAKLPADVSNGANW